MDGDSVRLSLIRNISMMDHNDIRGLDMFDMPSRSDRWIMTTASSECEGSKPSLLCQLHDIRSNVGVNDLRATECLNCTADVMIQKCYPI